MKRHFKAPPWMEPLLILLIPVFLVVAVATQLVVRLLRLKTTHDSTPADVAKSLREFIEGTGGDTDWDDFESVPITDPELDRIREEAARAGPPNPDMARLRQLLAEAEAMIDGGNRQSPSE